jgi:hypothetical protein
MLKDMIMTVTETVTSLSSVTCLVSEGITSHYVLCCKVFACGASLTQTVTCLHVEFR